MRAEENATVYCWQALLMDCDRMLTITKVPVTML